MKRIALIIFTLGFVIFGIQSQMAKKSTDTSEISITNDVVSLADLFKDKTKYANETIKVRGEVVKYNSGIMGKNWIHIQDGTEFSGKKDLTITTDMVAKLGDTINIEGKITLDKDLGAGYFYDVIMEGAKIIKE